MSRYDTCRLCPRLCRDACPVASATSEAAVPTFLAEVLDRNERGALGDDAARDVLTRCTDCGGCQSHCHLHRPLPEWLRAARARLLPRPPVAPIGEVDGPEGAPVLVAADERHEGPIPGLGAVAVLRTRDRLGVAALEHGELDVHFAQLRVRLQGRQVLAADGGVGAVLRAAGIPFRWLWEAVSDPAPAQGSCGCGGERGLSCCGGAGPLAAHHPEDAARVARLFAARGGAEVRDARCRDHLRTAGIPARDTLDRLRASG